MLQKKYINKDNGNTEIVKDFAYLSSVIHHNGDCSQEIKRSPRLGKAAMGESGETMKTKDVLLETKARPPTPSSSQLLRADADMGQRRSR